MNQASNYIKTFIKGYEKLSLIAYPDADGYSYGYGHFGANKGETITIEEAEHLFELDIADAETKLRRWIKVADQLNQSQYDALVSFYYNVGYRSDYTLHKLVNNNSNDPAIWHKLQEYTKARINGELVSLRGLEIRRLAEADLYFQDMNVLSIGENEVVIANTPKPTDFEPKEVVKPAIAKAGFWKHTKTVLWFIAAISFLFLVLIQFKIIKIDLKKWHKKNKIAVF